MRVNAEGVGHADLEAVVTCGGCGRQFGLGVIDSFDANPVKRSLWKRVGRRRALRKIRVWNDHQATCHPEEN